MIQMIVSSAFAVIGLVAVIVAVTNERRMQRHRRPNVSYADVTFRRDGAWRRKDLFDAQGLVYQRRAAASGMLAAACWLTAIVAWALLA